MVKLMRGRNFNASATLIGNLELTLGAVDFQAYYDDQFEVTMTA